MADQLSKLGIEGSRVEAVTVDEVPTELVAAHRHRDSLWRLRTGDLACGLSHQRAWGQLLSGEHPAALVLEDDAMLSPAIRDFLDPGLMHRFGADLIKLETYRKQIKLGRTSVAVGDTQLFELCSSQMGGAAYLITREAAARSLASPLRNTMGVDRLLFGRGGVHLLRSHILQAWPSPVVQLDRFAPDEAVSRSDIKASLTPQRAPSSLPRVKSLLSLNLDHAERLFRLTLRDPGTWFRPRRVVPFAGDSVTTA